jgi:hypothetical protein
MEANARAKAAARQEDFLAHKLAQKTEREYEARVQTLLREQTARR